MHLSPQVYVKPSHKSELIGTKKMLRPSHVGFLFVLILGLIRGEAVSRKTDVVP